MPRVVTATAVYRQWPCGANYYCTATTNLWPTIEHALLTPKGTCLALMSYGAIEALNIRILSRLARLNKQRRNTVIVPIQSAGY